jgi:PhzF family phenazine biosynthesis protein
MQKTAAELRYSETAFVRPQGDGNFETRYFTPEGEVDLCGHATIAAFCVLRWEGVLKSGDSPANLTKAGRLQVRLEEDQVLMDMAPPKILSVLDSQGAREELAHLMGMVPETVTVTDLDGNPRILLPMVVSTGLPDVLLPVSSPEKLASLNPDMDALAAWSKSMDVVGVHAFAPGGPGGPCAAFCRNFAPLYGIPEEAATGTSNGALAYYLFQHRLLAAGIPAHFIQGREMDRPSLIVGLAELRGGENGTLEIKVGGSGVLLARGEIFLD